MPRPRPSRSCPPSAGAIVLGGDSLLKRDKERVVAELVERLRASDTFIVADYRGLTMSEIDGVRTELLKHGARFSVVKNTLTKRAAEQAGVPSLVELRSEEHTSELQ